MVAAENPAKTFPESQPPRMLWLLNAAAPAVKRCGLDPKKTRTTTVFFLFLCLWAEKMVFTTDWKYLMWTIKNDVYDKCKWAFRDKPPAFWLNVNCQKPATDTPLTLHTPTHAGLREGQSAGLEALRRRHAARRMLIKRSSWAICKEFNKKTTTTQCYSLCMSTLAVYKRELTQTVCELAAAFPDNSPNPSVCHLHPRASWYACRAPSSRGVGVGRQVAATTAAGGGGCMCACHTPTRKKRKELVAVVTYFHAV